MEGQSIDSNFTLWMTIAVLAMTALALLVILIYRIAIQRMWEEQEKVRVNEEMHQRNLLDTSIQSQDKERQRIAADLHDELTSRLNVVRLQMYQLPEYPTEVMNQLDEVIHLSRNLAHQLYPPLLAEVGLGETILDYLSPLRQQFSTYTRLADLSTVDINLQLQLFRIFQEQLQNIVKYAKASSLEVVLKRTSTSFQLRIVDNGIGYDQQQITPGMGLSNIESRVQMVGGVFRITSQLGKGTRLLIVIPIRNETY